MTEPGHVHGGTEKHTVAAQGGRRLVRCLMRQLAKDWSRHRLALWRVGGRLPAALKKPSRAHVAATATKMHR